MSLPLWSRRIRPATYQHFRTVVERAEATDALYVVESNARRLRLELRNPGLSSSPLKAPLDVWLKRRERPGFFADVRLVGESGRQYMRASVRLHTYESFWGSVALLVVSYSMFAGIYWIVRFFIPSPADQPVTNVVVPVIGVAFASAMGWFLYSFGRRDFRELRDAVRECIGLDRRSRRNAKSRP